MLAGHTVCSGARGVTDVALVKAMLIWKFVLPKGS